MSICSRRRTNELKAEVDIPDDIIMKFRQFWSDFKDTPLKGAATLTDTKVQSDVILTFYMSCCCLYFEGSFIASHDKVFNVFVLLWSSVLKCDFFMCSISFVMLTWLKLSRKKCYFERHMPSSVWTFYCKTCRYKSSSIHSIRSSPPLCSS